MSLLVLCLLALAWNGVAGQLILNSEKNKLRQIRRKEDYSFESKLKRATEECSYIARRDDDSYRDELLQKIKSEINNQRVVKFYKEREEEKKRSKKYYEKVEKEVRNQVLTPELPPPRRVQHPRLDFERRTVGHPPPKIPASEIPHNSRRIPAPEVPPHLPRRIPASEIPDLPRRIPAPEVPPHLPRRIPASEVPPPPRRASEVPHPPRRIPAPEIHVPPWVLETIEPSEHHKIFKRSKDPSFFQGTFKDHNNCFSRCVFARMELVDSDGFPHESYLRKALEDYIDNRKIRSAKIRRVYRCFDDIKKVAIDDNCIYSTRIFKCMKLDEQGTWT